MNSLRFAPRPHPILGVGGLLLLVLAGCRSTDNSPPWNLEDEMADYREIIRLPSPDEIPFVDNRFHLFRLAQNSAVRVWYWDGLLWQELDQEVFIPEGWYVGPDICPIEEILPVHDDPLRP
jgi:hypothetical protein